MSGQIRMKSKMSGGAFVRHVRDPSRTKDGAIGEFFSFLMRDMPDSTTEQCAPSDFSHIDMPPNAVDPILHLNALFKADSDPNKINLSVGAYRDEQGKPYILKCVKKAEQLLQSNPEYDHEYLQMEGIPSFTRGAARIMLGSTPCFENQEYLAIQTISGTGAVRLGAEFLSRFRKSMVYVGTPTWVNHAYIFKECQMDVQEYSYWNATSKSLDWKSLQEALELAPNGSIFLLHACAHNPTGVDPTREEWISIAKKMKEKNHFPFFDCAYQGFASGLDQDAWAVRYFIQQGFEMVIAQSFSKNLGLYGERVGCLVMIVKDKKVHSHIHAHLCKLIRASYTSPPSYGAKIANLVLNTPELYSEWQSELLVMSSRIKEMRHVLHDKLVQLQTPGSWDHIIQQIGMFSFTGLSVEQCQTLAQQFHIYLIENGRISMAGLNHYNIDRFAKCVDFVVRNIK